MCTTFKGHWTIPTHRGFLFRYARGMSALSAAAACQPILFEHHQFLFDNRGHCALSSSLWNWELSNCMETQLFCVFTLRVSVRVCGGVCESSSNNYYWSYFNLLCIFYASLTMKSIWRQQRDNCDKEEEEEEEASCWGVWGIYTIYCWWFYKCA